MPRREQRAEGGRRRADIPAFSVPRYFFRPAPSTIRLLVFTCCLCLLPMAAVLAQTASPPTLPAALERPDVTRPNQRTELQQELEQHAKVLEAQSSVVKIVAKLIGPSVVYIEADIPPEANSTYTRNRPVEEAGSGVVIELKGNYYILTNRHVIRGAPTTAIRINLADGRRIQPKKVLEDPPTDVAVLEVSESDLIAAPLGNSDSVETGDFVLAVGSPFGLSQSVTYGIISAKGRRSLHLGEAETVEFQDFMQTDASINPGNSGGPLVNLRGEVIGINTAIATTSGIYEGVGFAIPIKMFMIVGRQLIETGEMARGFMGVKLSSNFGPAMAAELGLPRPVGAYVTGVEPKSPADAAKLQAGDVILEFNRVPVEDNNHLINLVSLTPVGKSVPLVVFRDRKPLTVLVEVGRNRSRDHRQ